MCAILPVEVLCDPMISCCFLGDIEGLAYFELVQEIFF